VLRHRILLSFEAEANGMTTNKVINELITRVPVA
jgi:MoxR-like ATPase